MKSVWRNARLAVWLGLALIPIVLGGCASTESDNLSSRPWNAPTRYDTGLPSALTDQQR